MRELEKMATNLMTKLAALHEQMDKAKASTVAVFQISQPFFDECEVYYSDGFDDYLKQVVAIYPDLDLPQVSIDNTIPLTPGGSNAVTDKTNDSVHTIKEEVKDPNAEVVIKPTTEGLVAPVVPSATDGPSIADGPSIVD